MADAEEVKELYKKIRDIQSKQLKIQNEFIRTFRQEKNKTTQQQPETSSSNTTTETSIESKNNALIQALITTVSAFRISASSSSSTVPQKLDTYDDAKTKADDLLKNTQEFSLTITRSTIEENKEDILTQCKKFELAVKKFRNLVIKVNIEAQNAMNEEDSVQQEEYANKVKSSAFLCEKAAENMVKSADELLFQVSAIQDISNYPDVNSKLNDIITLAKEAKTDAATAKEKINAALDEKRKNMIQKDAVAANQKKNMLVLLNNLINETSIVSMLSDKRYLYTIQIKENDNYTNVFKNEEIEYEEDDVDTKPNDDDDDKPKETEGKTMQKLKELGSKVDQIVNNKLDTAVIRSEKERDYAVKNAEKEQERYIAQLDKEIKNAKSELESQDDNIMSGIPITTLPPENIYSPIKSTPTAPSFDRNTNSGGNKKGGANSINQRLIFNTDIPDLKYDDIYIVEYRTDNIEEIDKNINADEGTPGDFYQYIANFQEYIKKNNEGKDLNFADRTKDRSLAVKKYPIHQYFAVFNRNHGFDYKGAKNAYAKGGTKYIKSINSYDERLDVFLQELENYKNNKDITDPSNRFFGRLFFKSYNIDFQHMIYNYYGFIIIILILLILFSYHLNTFTSFVNSVYQRKLSLQDNILNDSMYIGYADIAKVYMPGLGERYYERIAMSTFLAYFLLFVFLILVNLWYISDTLQGRLRVWNFVPLHWFLNSTYELYVFDKRANFVMYYGLMILIFIIIFNILYYLIIYTTLSDTFKARYESNKELQELYENIDKDLLKDLLDNNIEEVDGVKLNTIDLKLAHWMYGGTVQQLETRIGRTNPEAADMENTKKKRFKILLTVVFVKHYVGPKYKKELSNITDIEEDPLPNVFLYSRSQLLDGVLPQRYDKVVFGNTLDIINRPPEDLRNEIAAKNKSTSSPKDITFCQNIGDQFYCGAGKDNNDFSFLDGDTLLLNQYFNKNYQQVYRSIQDARRKIKSQNSAILYRIDVILSFIFMLLIGFCLLQIFLWLFFDNIDVYEIFFIKHKSKLQTIFQIIVVVVILIVIL